MSVTVQPEFMNHPRYQLRILKVPVLIKNLQIFLHRKIGVTMRSFNQIAHIIPTAETVLQGLSQHFEMACIRSDHSQQDPEECGFTGTVESDDSMNFACFDLNGHIIQGCGGTKTFGEGLYSCLLYTSDAADD